MFSIFEVIDDGWQITKSNVFFIIELVAHYQGKFSVLVKLFVWLKILWVLQLSSHLVHSLGLWLHEIQQKLLFLLAFHLFFHCFFFEKLLLAFQSHEKFFSFSGVYVKLIYVRVIENLFSDRKK